METRTFYIPIPAAIKGLVVAAIVCGQLVMMLGSFGLWVQLPVTLLVTFSLLLVGDALARRLTKDQTLEVIAQSSEIGYDLAEEALKKLHKPEDLKSLMKI